MATRKNSLDRKKDLIRAAEAAVLQYSLARLTIREIAAHAEMSPGSVLYHYPKTTDLVYDLHRDVVDRYVEQRMTAIEGERGASRRLLRAFSSGLPADSSDRVCRLLYELHGLALHSEAHAKLMTSLWDREVMLFESLVAAGADAGEFELQRPSQEIATVLLALEDGFGLHIVSGNSRLVHSQALRVLARQAGELLNFDFEVQLESLSRRTQQR